MTEARQRQLVLPFYLKLMRTNAVESGAALAPAVIAVGVTTTAEEVVALLGVR